MSDFTYNLKHNFMNLNEWKDLLIASLVLGFIVSFRDWGTTSFNMLDGLKNFIIAIILVGITVFVHDVGHRFYGFTLGYRVETFLWKTGLLISVFFCLISNGHIWFLAPGGLIVYHLERQRLGYFRYGIKIFDLAKINLVGPIANILLALLFQYLFAVFGLPIFQKAMIINIVFAICNMLPLPCLSPTPSFAGHIQEKTLWHAKGPLNGLAILIGSRGLFVFMFATVCIIGLLLMFMPGGFAIVWGLLLALMILIIFFNRVESSEM